MSGPRTIRDLTHLILNTGDFENGSGYIVSPEIRVVDETGQEFKVVDLYTTMDQKAVIKIERV
tara:strand:- start:59316 stop:59504 length:189 start_codon:yes stop_codon:yes gene_type:complete